MTPEDRQWSTIWPTYLNSAKTTAEGRRVPKTKGVENPRWQEIKDVLEATKDFTVQADPVKVYPRELDKEMPINRGRVKYQTTDPKYQKKRAVLLYLAEMIPKLKSRAKGAGGAVAATEQTAGQGGSKSKKKGRK
jgi:signal recognition particle subunit SRP19